ncbi:sigma-70 family RNA polymerase sigma factor [Streptomyces sp. J2-1]|uniref:RNA polymerase sigma factor n=1 Tax=Streptomyces corallincola TaxID=2851888 RepID=UPI001C394BDB|nr:sigma-70 family RNA polymerase sigma factor [Streptomyces corallincola]MBV2357382.1 sigma-70 family RNA polymerase sigma factor [Streptomyces corallincola]
MTGAPERAAQWERRIQVRLVRGEAAALGELYDRHARSVYAIAARLVGEDKAAREIVTEVFAHLWQHPQTYDPARHRLGTWLAMDTRERVAERAKGDGPGPVAPRQAPTEPEFTEPRAERIAADRALGALSTRVRAVLQLVHTGHRDYRRAASELGISEEETLRCLRAGLRSVAGAGGIGAEDR